MRASMLKGHLEALVLAVLADGSNHGYAILSALRSRTGGAVAIEGGSLYPLLRRLEERGLVASQWVSDGRRDRRIYSLSPAGSRLLSDERSAWADFVDALAPLLDPRQLSEGEGVS